MEKNISRRSPEYNFFGNFYIEGDNSIEGYLIDKKQTLNERTTEEVNGIIKLTKIDAGAKILDCPCGYGRHSIQLAKNNLLVTGSDINETHLSRAKANALQENTDIVWEKESMIDIRYDNEFDVVINMFYSFGFFETDEENEKVLKNFYDALKKNGRFLMHTDVNIPRIISGKYKKDEIRNLQNGNTLRIIDDYNPATKRIEGARIITDKQGMSEKKEYSVRVYTKEEFVELCKKVGFTQVETFSNWDGEPYSPEAEDMIIIATK